MCYCHKDKLWWNRKIEKHVKTFLMYDSLYFASLCIFRNIPSGEMYIEIQFISLSSNTILSCN